MFQDYFPVYRGNTILISRIKDNDLRRRVVSVYTMASSMVDSVRMNNDLVAKFERWQQVFAETKNSVYQQRAADYLNRCVAYAKTMKEMHTELKEEVADLLRLLQKRGVLVEFPVRQILAPQQ